MGRAAPLGGSRRSIGRQAALRLVVSLGLFVVLLGACSYRLYSLALHESAHGRAEDLAGFYRTRLLQLDRDLELQARSLKVRLEFTRLLEIAPVDMPALQAFMTLQETDRRFRYMMVADARGDRIFAFGSGLDVARVPLPGTADSGWYFAAADGDLYRVFVVPVWLGREGTGRMAVFYPIDNSCLFNLATPGIVLTAKHGVDAIASSAGATGMTAVQVPAGNDAAEQRDIVWGTDAAGPIVLTVFAPIKVLFSTTELAAGAAAIPVVDGLILWFGLGFWLMRVSRRIRHLGGAVDEFSSGGAISDSLTSRLRAASGHRGDEISDVASAFDGMARLIVRREQEREDQEAQRRLWAMVFASSSEAVVVTDSRNDIVAVNPAFCRMTGYSEAEVIGRNPRILASGLESRDLYARMWKEINERGMWAGEVHDRRKDGSVYPKWLTINAVRDGRDRVTHFVGIFVDISDRKQVEERFLHLANHDSLTGLPNRNLLTDRLQTAINSARRSEASIALLFLDLDNFKWVNDSLGHGSGDKLLIAVADCLTATVRVSDTVARLGGDEFVVMVEHHSGDIEVSQIAHKIVAAISRPIDLNGHEFHVTTSIGISTFPNDGDNAAMLLQHADTAMYAAKAAGKNQYRYFDQTMNQSARDHILLEGELRTAIKRNELELHYQPKLGLAANSICSAEALVRWRHPVNGLIPPARFIPLAEESTLIIELGEWVIRAACLQITEWRRAGLTDCRIAVNLSAIQLESDSFVESVEAILAETGVPVESLEFELTESMVLRNPDRSVATLNRLRRLGIRLALDDFGTGYSSLSYLKRLPVDTVKIDRSFIEGIPDDADDCQFVRMIVALAKSVRLEVVAEGIETEAQCDFLKKLGCDLLQGYLISKPLPAADFFALLTTRGGDDGDGSQLEIPAFALCVQ